MMYQPVLADLLPLRLPQSPGSLFHLADSRCRRALRPCALLLCSLLLIAGCAGFSTGALAQPLPPSIAGVWQINTYTPRIRTEDGSLPPFTDAGLRAYQANQALHGTLKPRNDMSRCVPSGTPRAMWAPLPLMILQTARKITFIQEYHHQLRHIYLDEPLPAVDAIELSFMGESVGHWDTDTLVIETIGLHKDTALDREGLPHTSDLHISERLQLLPDGNQLENMVTFTDAAYYSAPWSTRVVYDRKPAAQLQEYNCLSVYEDL
jgi:hypothetical protein